MKGLTLSEIKPLSIFDYIREINKLPSNILTPAKFKILVEIAMRIGENGKTWPKNKELSENTAIKVSSIRVLLSQLKKENFINILSTNGKRMIYLCHPTEKKMLMTINENGKMLMVINTDVNDHLHRTYYKKENKKKKSKEKSEGAAPDCFENYHPYLDEVMRLIPDAIRGQLSRPFVNKCLWEKNGDRPYFNWLFENCVDKRDPAGWVAEGMMGYYAGYLKTLKN